MVSLMAHFSGWRFVDRRGWCQNAHPVALTIAYDPRSRRLWLIFRRRKFQQVSVLINKFKSAILITSCGPISRP
jgi:hypothetical protein